jgi:glutathione synthase/RimK-type ligase-like ATP-grasp enzyme
LTDDQLHNFFDKIDDIQNDVLGDILHKRPLLNEKPSKPSFLILTSDFDLEANLVGIGLRKQGIDYVRMSMKDVSKRLKISYEIGDGQTKFNFDINDRTFKISENSVVWLRNFNIKEITFKNSQLLNLFLLQSWESSIVSFFSNLDCTWINSISSSLKGNDKVYQLINAKKFGFEIPDTLITNEIHRVRNFYNLHNKDIIMKTINNHSIEFDGKIYSRYTRPLTDNVMPKFKNCLISPFIFQKRIKCSYELRVTIIGDRIFVAKLDRNFNLNRSFIPHQGTFPHSITEYLELSDNFKERCIQFVDSLGLVYGALDFIVDSKGGIFFLEINPTGDWYWIEKQTRMPITKAMIDLIVGYL